MTDQRDPMVSFRMPPELLDAVDVRATSEEMTRSQWLRELVGVVVAQKVALADLLRIRSGDPGPDRIRSGSSEPQRIRSDGELGASRVVVRGRCLHPVHLVQEFATYKRCACGRKWQL